MLCEFRYLTQSGKKEKENFAAERKEKEKGKGKEKKRSAVRGLWNLKG
jgi:hypothetical protein